MFLSGSASGQPSSASTLVKSPPKRQLAMAANNLSAAGSHVNWALLKQQSRRQAASITVNKPWRTYHLTQGKESGQQEARPQGRVQCGMVSMRK
jgi:hypothetical protein